MILKKIADYAKHRVIEDQEKIPYAEMERLADAVRKKEEKDFGSDLINQDFSFEQRLSTNHPAFICEVKKASPSKGIISQEFPYLEIAEEYESIGATCISVLTEPKWFLGSDQIFQEIRKKVSLPMLRKDFTIDAYQIYQAKVLGADAVLLICSLLNLDTLKRFINIAEELGMSCLVEAHNSEEIEMALTANARIIGVNNRNLKDFSVDLNNAGNLRKQIPENVIFVAESGITSPEDGKKLVEQGADALLIGEALMRADNRQGFLEKIRNP